MLSRRILTLSLLLTAVSAYLYLFQHIPGFVWGLATGVFLVTCSYIFQYQINWWWYRRYPPKFPAEMEAMYVDAGKYYAGLNTTQQAEFRMRASLFIEAKEFIAQGLKEMPEDIKYLIAYYAVMVSFEKADFMYTHYGRIVLYLHPFLSPQIPDQIHAYETEHEDGTVIFSLEQLNAGFLRPDRYYQIGLHAFAELLIRAEGSLPSISDIPATWKSLEEISGWTQESISNFTGIPQTDPLPVMIHHWFTFHDKMVQMAPGISRIVQELVGKSSQGDGQQDKSTGKY